MKTAQLYTERLSALQSEMARQGVDLIAIAPTANMRYLIGFAPLMDERLCALLVGVASTRLLIPELNADQVEAHTGLSTLRWSDADGPHKELAEALDGLGIKAGAVLAADDTMRADSLLFLQDMVKPKQSVVAGNLMTPLRIRKSDQEIELMARSAALADAALLAGAEACRPGVTERQVGDTIARYFHEHGAEAVDFVIVASGPNGAFPHHETGDRRLETGDTIIIDIGATLGGYKSDIARVVQLGEPTAEVSELYEAVLEANRRGRQAAVSGARAHEVDLAARESLEQAGLGAYFTHRTGHGLGLEGHEPPWITSKSQTQLEPGMVFSVEPGVYIPGKLGVRIEDIVVITEGESRNLTGLDQALIVKS
jgi:Xaa-Pro aminopeptidase